MNSGHPLRRLAIRWFCSVPAVLVLLASCSGSDLYPVTGKVLYKDQPAAGAVVVFHPKGDSSLEALRATGVTREDGSFQLTTGTKAGAKPGPYVVTIIWPEEENTGKFKAIGTEPPPSPPDRLKGKYANQTRSALTAEIKAATNDLEPFNLE